MKKWKGGMLSFLVLILTNGSFFPVSIFLSDDMVGSLKNPNQKKQSLIRFTRLSIQVNQCVRAHSVLSRENAAGQQQRKESSCGMSFISFCVQMMKTKCFVTVSLCTALPHMSCVFLTGA